MPSLSELTPAERARLAGKPEGELGIATAVFMNQNNAGIIEAVYRRLNLESGHNVIEIGFGNGRTLPLLMQQAEALTYVGIDISETMVAEANRFNRGLIGPGRASFRLASAEAIPCADASFDRAIAINVVYFWPDPVRVLTEIRRVLRPGGCSIIAGIDTATAAAAPFTRVEFGFRARDGEMLKALHHEAGFATVEVEPYVETAKHPDGTPFPRTYNLIVGQT